MSKQNKVSFLTFEQFHGKREIGSSMIRCKWLLPYWPEAELFKLGQTYDTIIYQKCYWPDHAEKFKGIKILDVCDPDFMWWQYPIKRMVEACDAITCNTMEMAKAYANFAGDKPIWVIPDRVNLDVFKKRKVHKGRAKRVTWYGYSDNFDTLKAALSSIAKRGLDLVVVSNKNFMLPHQYIDKIKIFNLPWADTTWQNDIIKGDIVINPAKEEGKYKYKSNNKTLNAWALGMPMAYTDDDLDYFMEEKNRISEQVKRDKELKEKYDCKKSVEEYQKLIEEIKETKGGTWSYTVDKKAMKKYGVSK